MQEPCGGLGLDWITQARGGDGRRRGHPNRYGRAPLLGWWQQTDVWAAGAVKGQGTEGPGHHQAAYCSFAVMAKQETWQRGEGAQV